MDLLGVFEINASLNIPPDRPPTSRMPLQSFYLLGEDPATARDIDVDQNTSFNYLQQLIASHYAIVVPTGKRLSPKMRRYG
jgi:hypothetical protein